MVNQLSEAAERIHILLFSRDLQRLDAFRGSRITRTKAIRVLLNQALNAIEAKSRLEARPLELSSPIDTTE